MVWVFHSIFARIGDVNRCSLLKEYCHGRKNCVTGCCLTAFHCKRRIKYICLIALFFNTLTAVVCIGRFISQQLTYSYLMPIVRPGQCSLSLSLSLSLSVRFLPVDFLITKLIDRLLYSLLYLLIDWHSKWR